MSNPDIATAGTWIGLIGGSVGIITGGIQLIAMGRRALRAKRDAVMVLAVEFGDYQGHQGPTNANFPVATARIFNNGKVDAWDIAVTSSTGYAKLDVTKNLAPNTDAIITFAIAPSHEVEDQWRASKIPTVPGPVELAVTWRKEGKSDRDGPLTFTHDYSGPGF